MLNPNDTIVSIVDPIRLKNDIVLVRIHHGHVASFVSHLRHRHSHSGVIDVLTVFQTLLILIWKRYIVIMDVSTNR